MRGFDTLIRNLTERDVEQLLTMKDTVRWVEEALKASDHRAGAATARPSR
jgi:hypothetical protein